MPVWKTLQIRPEDKTEVQRLAFNEDKYEYEIVKELLNLRRNVGDVSKLLKEKAKK